MSVVAQAEAGEPRARAAAAPGYSTPHLSGCWLKSTPTLTTDAVSAHREENVEGCRYLAGWLKEVDTRLGRISGNLATPSGGRSLVDVEAALLGGCNGCTGLRPAGEHLGALRDNSDSAYTQLGALVDGLDDQAARDDARLDKLAAISTTLDEISGKLDALVVTCSNCGAGGQNGGPAGSDEDPAYVRLASSEPTAATITETRDWMQANAWFAFGLLAALWFGSRLYRAVMPRG